MTPIGYWIGLLLLLFHRYAVGFQGTFRPFPAKRGAVGVRSPFAFVGWRPRPDPTSFPSSSQLFFFGRKNKEPKVETEEQDSEATVATSTKPSEEPLEPSSPAPSLTPQEKAAKLRADAERARLEAQRMDAELTLRKIEALEKKVKKNKEKPDEDDGAQLQEQINRLSQKFKEKTTASNNDSVTTDNGDSAPPETALPLPLVSEPTTTSGVVWPRFVIKGDDNEDGLTSEELWFIPNVAKALVVEKLSTVVAFNETAVNVGDKLTQALESFLAGDLSCLKAPEPRFTQAQLDEAKQKVEDYKNAASIAGGIDTMVDVDEAATALMGTLSQKIGVYKVDASTERNITEAMQLLAYSDDGDTVNFAANLYVNAFSRNPEASTEDLARLLLEYRYYTKKIVDSFDDDITDDDDILDRVIQAGSDDWYLKPFLRDQGDGNATLISYLDNMMDTMFPKSTTQLKKEDPVLPPQAKVDQLASEILPQTLFRATSRPEPVLGGFVIKGSSIPESDETYGDKVIQSINEKLAERKYAGVAEAMTVTYLSDFTYLENAQKEMLFEDETSNPPVLYICGPNISRASRPIQFSIVSAIGLATTWYLSLYPFLLNRGIASRVDEELAMIDAGVMAPDLSWLTELSLPLFLAFGSIQLLHEVAHGIVARIYGMKTFPPILVPSILTGITNSVTSLKTPPKNLNAMFDFAISGPLIGIAASAFAIIVGSRLTGSMDSTNFPALPLEILRQSTLGGGIINNVIGEGVLNVPVSALGSPAIAEMTVALHPLAVAGYIGLVVNALSLLPIGTTDGGRVALALFGRETKSVIGSFAFTVLLWFGVSGSDLFLYYFSFCIAFQSGNEIPAQNEVDKLSLSRVFLAVGAYMLAALALIPFQ